MNSDIDLEDFRLFDPGQFVETKTSRRRRRAKAGWFVKGPIPGPWIARAAELPGQSLHVALAIYHASAIEKRDRIAFTPKWRDLFKIGRYAVYGGLGRLERAGLVTVDWRIGASPIVTILEFPESQAASTGKGGP